MHKIKRKFCQKKNRTRDFALMYDTIEIFCLPGHFVRPIDSFAVGRSSMERRPTAPLHFTAFFCFSLHPGIYDGLRMIVIQA